MNKSAVFTANRVVAWLLAAGLCLAICSACSMHGSKTCASAPQTVQAPPAFDPETPYHTVDYSYPAAAVCNPKLYVFKSKRRLLVVQDGVLVRDYRIGLGPRPQGDKLIQGDGRTPEGEFFVCVKNPVSNFYKSLGLSYPSPKHAERALLAGDISHEQFRRIVYAIENKARPPWDTVLGGQIFIHGGGAQGDWTKGCIAVYNSAMDELFQMVSVGTSVTIMP
jgi:hypothetical protein